MRENSVKKSIDIDESLFESVMEYAYKEKIYKFGPSVVELLTIGLEKVKEDGNGGD